MSRVRACWRAARALGHVLRALWIIRFRLRRRTPAQTQWLVRDWSRQMLRIMGVELVLRGTAPTEGPLLLLANHSSWLDILVLNAAVPARFVSKADVRHWPLLGAIITGAGTLYIVRQSPRSALRVVHQMAERLQANEILAVFPEGTTGDGRALLPFHANLLQAAIAVHAPVLPVALRFVDAASAAPSAAPLFTGDTTLLASVWTTLCASNLQAVLTCGEPQLARGRDRRAWANDVQGEVERLLRPDIAAGARLTCPSCPSSP